MDHCSVRFESRWLALENAKTVLADLTDESNSIYSSLKEVLVHKELSNIDHEEILLLAQFYLVSNAAHYTFE